MSTYLEAEPTGEPGIDAEVTAVFNAGLHELTRMSGGSANFAWCLAQLAEQPEFEVQFRDMLGFYCLSRKLGVDIAFNAHIDNQGIPVTVRESEDKNTIYRGGYVVGILGSAHQAPGRFECVARTVLDDSAQRSCIKVIADVGTPGVVEKVQ